MAEPEYPMRLILSRKGFDSTSGGCPSPIFPDGAMISLPIPDKTSPVRYSDLSWRDRDFGDLVVNLTRGKQRADYRAHLDPDLRRESRPRKRGWRPNLGQHASSLGHLRNQGVGVGDIFLFWGVFQAVDDEFRRSGRPEHRIWGWMQVGSVVSVDDVIRKEPEKWTWTEGHPHLAFPRDPTNTLYVASKQLSMPGVEHEAFSGAGVFDRVVDSVRLTAPDARNASEWLLPRGFLPKGRPPLTYHTSSERWSLSDRSARLQAVARGQEFVLDLELYPELVDWVLNAIRRHAGRPDGR